MHMPPDGTRLQHALAALATVSPDTDRKGAEDTVIRQMTQSRQQVLGVDVDTEATLPEHVGRWLVGSSVMAEPGDASPYGLAIVHMLAGIATEAVLYSSLDGTTVWASLGSGASGPGGRIQLDVAESGVGEMTISMQDPDASARVAARLRAAGYSAVVVRHDAFSLALLVSGRFAGLIADRTDSATRMAAALLISEARGRVCHWKGAFPTLAETSMLAARNPAYHAAMADAIAPELPAPAALVQRRQR